MPTLPWELEEKHMLETIPHRTIYSRKIEYKENCFGFFKFCHYWSTGYDKIIEPTWVKKHGAYGMPIYNEKDEVKKDMLFFSNKNKYNLFCGNEIISDTKTIKEHESQTHGGVKVNIGKNIKKMVITTFEDMVVIRYFRCYIKCPTAGEKLSLQEWKRTFIKGDTVWDEYKINPENKYYWQEKNIKKALSTILWSGKNGVFEYDDKVVDVLRKNSNGILIREKHCRWFDYIPSFPKNDKFQKQINTYNQFVMNFIPNFDDYKLKKEKTNTEDFPYESDVTKQKKISIIEKIGNGLYVVRFFYKNDFSQNEYARVFIDEHKIYPCYYHNGQVTRCNIVNNDFWNTDNKMEIKMSNTFINKKYPFFLKRKIDNFIYCVLLNEQNLFIEQFEKMGFKNFANTFYQNDRELAVFKNIYRNLKGKVDWKTSGLNKMFSKYQLKRLCLFNKEIQNCSHLEEIMKLIDNEKIDSIDFLKMISEEMPKGGYDNIMYQFPKIVCSLSEICNERQLKNLSIKIWRQFRDIYNRVGEAGEYEKKHNYISFYHIFSLLKDTYWMFPNAFKSFDICYENMSEFATELNPDRIKEMHDKIQTICDFGEFPEERYNKIKEKYSDKEYQDDNFILRVPMTTQEIIEEGSRMNHCVGGYVRDVMRGNTMIMLLRKKEKPEKEYVTIELGVDNSLIQVKCNSNNVVSSKSTLEFLTNWVKNKKIKPKTRDLKWQEDGFTVCDNPYVGYYIEEDSIVSKKDKKKTVL